MRISFEGSTAEAVQKSKGNCLKALKKINL